jgi:hypothetical protein
MRLGVLHILREKDREVVRLTSDAYPSDLIMRLLSSVIFETTQD